MGWRNLIVSNPAKLRMRQNNLLVEQEDIISIPLDDICSIVFESRESNISSALLSVLADKDIAAFFCNEEHIPNGVLLPFSTHSRHTKIINMQIQLSEPFKKRCWQKIVKQKIKNQGECLGFMGFTGKDTLLNISDKVTSGDKNNSEATAARFYFSKLFYNFKRGEDSNINIALNYGYSILRGAIARTISSYGFIPALGLHHKSELNSFNLADDFIEPYRPIVDMWVKKNIKPDETFSSYHKQRIIGLLEYECITKGQIVSVRTSIDRVVASFSSCCTNNNFDLLKLPELMPLGVFEYE